MTISRSLALAIIAGTGIAGAFTGRAVPYDAPSVQEDAGASPAPSDTTPAEDVCEPERTALASTKAQLAICKVFDTRNPEIAPSAVPEQSEPAPPSSLLAEFRSYHERLESLSEAVIVRHANGTIGVYQPEEWPIDGDGLIIGRKLRNGQIGWYAGPDAGPRSDPAAFRSRKGVQ